MSNTVPGSPGRSYAGLSHAERLAGRRSALLEAGTRLFSEQGFRGTTVRAVCQAAQLNDRYFYALFEGLEDLLVAVYEHWSGQLLAQQAAALAAAQPLELRLETALRAWFRFMRQAPVARILLLEVAGVSPQVDAAYKRRLAQFGTLLAEAAAADWDRRGLERADRRIASTALVGALITAATYWHLGGYRESEARMVQNCRAVLLGAIRQLDGEAAPPAQAGRR